MIYHEEISIYAITSSKGRLQKEEKSPTPKKISENIGYNFNEFFIFHISKNIIEARVLVYNVQLGKHFEFDFKNWSKTAWWLV